MASANYSRIGYGFGLRQPEVTHTLRFRCPRIVDLAGLDGWLKNTFDLDIEPLPVAESQGAGAGWTLVAVAWRILLLARDIRQAAGLPVFEPGKLLKLAAAPNGPGETHVLVAVPQVDGHPLQALVLACETATAVILRGVDAGRERLDLEALYKEIDVNAVTPLKALSGSGVSTLPLLRAAYQQGIPFRHLGDGVYLMGWGYRARLIQRSAVSSDSAIGSRCSAQKDLAAKILRAAGLPAPEHFRVSNERQAALAAESLGWPVVVKPADRDRSEGVTMHVDTLEKLQEGLKAALAFSPKVLVERQVPGICIRLLVADGRFMYAISRKPVAVTGDGIQTVGELIRAKAARAAKVPIWRRSKLIDTDALTLSAVHAQGLTCDAIPEKERVVSLRAIESSEWGGDIEDVTDRVHPDNIDLAIRTARLFGLRNAGIDLITTDIAVPWYENGAVLTEVNFSPYFGGNPTARAKMPDFLSGFIEQDGRLPIEVFVGGAPALASALARQREQHEAGVASFLTSHDLTLDQQGHPFPIASGGSFDRSLSLLMNQEVKALIIVAQTDEWLYTGLPVDRLDKIHYCDGVLATRATSAFNGKVAKDRLLKLMKSYTAGGEV